MARIRSVKPEFWHDPDMADELTRDQRLLYIGLWNLCFDNWTMEYDPRNIKRELFGYDDDVNSDCIDAWIHRLADTGRVWFFEHEGRTCIYLPKCVEHQQVNRPTRSPIPVPDSASPHAPLTEDSPLELGTGKGKERTCSPKPSEHYDAEFKDWWTFYPRKQSKPDAFKAFKAARKKGATLADLHDGLERAIASDSRFRERKYTPLPASWLRAEGWADEFDTPAPTPNPWVPE